MSLTKKSVFADILFIAAGCVFFALGFSVFIEPNGIAPGGATGVAVIINHFVKIPIGSLIILLNVPLIIIGFMKFKFRFVLKTSVAILLSSTLIDLFDLYLPRYKNDIILSALAGGVLTGAGIAFIMLRGATTGGTDIVAKLINYNKSHLSIGKIILIVDVVIVALAAVLFKSFETALYSVLYLFILSVVTDKLIYGTDHGKMLFIITKDCDNLMKEIIREANRGITKINAYGGYTGNEKSVLLCAVRPSEVAQILSVVKCHDREAFVIVSDVGEIIGEGFKAT